MMMMLIFSVLQYFVWSNPLFSNLQPKLLTDDIIKNVRDVINNDVYNSDNNNTFVTSSYTKEFLTANSHLQFESSIQNTSFFQNLKIGNDITYNDVINFKINSVILALENQLRCKI